MTQEKLQKITACLEKLKDSKVVTGDHHLIYLSNICEAILTISDDAGYDIEYICKGFQDGDDDLVERNVESVKKRFYQISTIIEIVLKELSNDDYTKLSDLFFNYNNP